MPNQSKSLWQLLWEYDPNGLVVFDADLNILVTNPAFLSIFNLNEIDGLKENLGNLFEDVSDFEQLIAGNEDRMMNECFYPTYDRYVRKVMFPVRDENVYACIVVDQSESWKKDQEYRSIQKEAVTRLNALTTKQMKVAQKIASLLGETTAETKVNILKLQNLLERD